MALCRHFSRLSCRAFCSKADVVKVPQHAPPWSELLRAVEEHLAEPGKVFLPSLRAVLSQEMICSQEMNRLAEMRELQQKLIEKAEKVVEAQDMVIANFQEHVQYLTEQTDVVIASLQDRVQLLKKQKREQKVRDTLEILKLSGRNDTRGLFERMQEVLESRLNTTKKLRGTGLWEAILKSNPTLAKCVQDHTGVQVVDVAKQALQCYNIYSILSQHGHAGKELAELQVRTFSSILFHQHVHAGKELAELQVDTCSSILFHRGPMSRDQVCIFQWIGEATGFDIVEDPSTSRPDGLSTV